LERRVLLVVAMVRFPHRYQATIRRTAPSRATVESPPRPPIEGAPPPEFDGDPTAWSPEHLLVAALGLCLQTTFEALARRDQLHVHAWRSDVTGTLDRSSSGVAFTGFSVAVELTVDASEADRARDVMARARRHCFVSGALRAPVEVDLRISAAPGAAA
jgi:organic hydroperoxide reductase OsmC/OhrA